MKSKAWMWFTLVPCALIALLFYRDFTKPKPAPPPIWVSIPKNKFECYQYYVQDGKAVQGQRVDCPASVNLNQLKDVH
jgi:hypothetical protein